MDTISQVCVLYGVAVQQAQKKRHTWAPARHQSIGRRMTRSLNYTPSIRYHAFDMITRCKMCVFFFCVVMLPYPPTHQPTPPSHPPTHPPPLRYIVRRPRPERLRDRQGALAGDDQPHGEGRHHGGDSGGLLGARQVRLSGQPLGRYGEGGMLHKRKHTHKHKKNKRNFLFLGIWQNKHTYCRYVRT